MKERQIIEDIFCIQNSLMSLTNKEVFDEFGLTLNSYIPLQMISHGMNNIQQMKSVYDESAASFGQKIQKLENMEFVVRELDTHDKRKWIFTLTKKGEDTIKKLEAKFLEVSQKFFSHFSEKEKQDLHTLLGKIGDNL